MIIQRTLVVIGIPGLGVPLREVARQLEHVEGVAGFRRIGTEKGRKPLLRRKRFVVAVAADDIGTFPRDHVPEEFTTFAVGFITGEFVAARHADELGDLGVGVQAGELVHAIDGRLEDRAVIETLGQFEVFGLAGNGVEIGQ